MAISLATVENDTWATVKAIIKADSTVTSYVSTNVYSAYPTVFLENAGGLPFVIIHRPQISERIETINCATKTYLVSFRIDCVATKDKIVKQTSDAVRNALETNRSTTEGVYLFDFTIDNEDEDWDFVEKTKIHYNTMTVVYEWRGAI